MLKWGLETATKDDPLLQILKGAVGRRSSYCCLRSFYHIVSAVNKYACLLFPRIGPSIIHHGRTRRWKPAPVHWDCQVLQFIHNHRKEECELCVYKLFSRQEISYFYVFLTTPIYKCILFLLSVCFGHICHHSSHRPFLQIEA